ncbi:hypothetical protein ABZ916_21365 [Streptomyces sp. NPDC046853]|uniref:hypothetical protein n=1 Tax=Streptomyces sp. NPDC046853 TaxID=3154920 RepID=UPI0033F0D6EF
MARFARTASRVRGPAAAMQAVLLAVLIALLGPSALSGEQPRVPSGTVAAVHTAASAGSAPHADDSAGSTPYADDPAGDEPHAQSAVPGLSPVTVTVRSHRDATGERHVPPLSAVGTSRGTAVGPLLRTVAPRSSAHPSASAHPALGHGVRAPPPLSGI